MDTLKKTSSMAERFYQETDILEPWTGISVG